MKQPRGDKSHITPDYKDMSAGCFVFPTSSKQPKQHRIVRMPNTERFSITLVIMFGEYNRGFGRKVSP